MTDTWTKRRYDCVEICIEQDLPVTASYVNEIVKQRSELLYALQGILETYLDPESGEIDRRLAITDARAAIENTKHLY